MLSRQLARPGAPAFRAALVLAFAALLCCRLPNVVLHGRLWAEEGTAFYLRAATLPWAEALFLPFGGYLNLVATGSAVLARHLVPLEYAPWVTTGIGLLFQCVPAVLLVCSRDAWLQRPLVLVACLLLIATPPVTEEVWLQSLHSQLHLALACALILSLELPSGGLRVFGYAVLFLAPLCGPAPATLAPLFLMRAGLDRSPGRLIQGGILLAGAGLQYVFFYEHDPDRGHHLGLGTLIAIVTIKQIAVPFLGRGLALPVAERLKGGIAAGFFPLRTAFVAAAYAGMLALLFVRRRLPAALWLAGAGVLLFAVAIYGSISDGPGLMTIGEAGRYTFLPQVLVALALAAVASDRATRWDVWLARALVVWLILVGVRDVARRDLFIGTGPDWRAEVARWRQDPTHPIALWPPGSTLALPPPNQ